MIQLRPIRDKGRSSRGFWEILEPQEQMGFASSGYIHDYEGWVTLTTEDRTGRFGEECSWDRAGVPDFASPEALPTPGST